MGVNDDTFFSDDVRQEPVKADRRPWIGVDFDGTLARTMAWGDFNDGRVGDPIWPMVYRVQEWLVEGRDVRILTARVGKGADVRKHTAAIDAFCLDNFGINLPVTCEKDFNMVELWDDKAVQVEVNTGEPTTFWNSKFA